LLLALLALTPSSALATGDATTAPGESCPNEASPGFRIDLPECRAYELITPPFKDAANPITINDIAEGGTPIVIHALGAFAGTESETGSQGAQYMLSRTTSGWSVSPISPPASSFPAQVLSATSADLSKTLWLARTPSESLAAENLYLREGDGPMVEVGALLPPLAVAGPPAGESDIFRYIPDVSFLEASADLSHILFEVEAGAELKWPGDAALHRARSLYEYVGTGQARPVLVGVSDGSTVVD
jgi:hypothetical protein